MKSFREHQIHNLTESLDYCDIQEGIENQLEILRIKLIESSKLPHLMVENLMEQSAWNLAADEDHRIQQYVIDNSIRYAKQYLYECLLESDTSVSLDTLRDEIHAKVSAMFDAIKDTALNGMKMSRGSSSPEIESEPEELEIPQNAPNAASPMDAMRTPSGRSQSSTPQPAPQPAPQSNPTYSREPLSGERPEVDGYKPAPMGSMLPGKRSSGEPWWKRVGGALRRSIIDPISNLGPVKNFRRRWHNDPTRQMAKESRLHFNTMLLESELDIESLINQAKNDFMDWLDKRLEQFAALSGLAYKNSSTGSASSQIGNNVSGSNLGSGKNDSVDVPISSGDPEEDEEIATGTNPEVLIDKNKIVQTFEKSSDKEQQLKSTEIKQIHLKNLNKALSVLGFNGIDQISLTGGAPKISNLLKKLIISANNSPLADQETPLFKTKKDGKPNPKIQSNAERASRYLKVKMADVLNPDNGMKNSEKAAFIDRKFRSMSMLELLLDFGKHLNDSQSSSSITGMEQPEVDLDGNEEGNIPSSKAPSITNDEPVNIDKELNDADKLMDYLEKTGKDKTAIKTIQDKLKINIPEEDQGNQLYNVIGDLFDGDDIEGIKGTTATEILNALGVGASAEEGDVPVSAPAAAKKGDMPVSASSEDGNVPVNSEEERSFEHLSPDQLTMITDDIEKFKNNTNDSFEARKIKKQINSILDKLQKLMPTEKQYELISNLSTQAEELDRLGSGEDEDENSVGRTVPLEDGGESLPDTKNDSEESIDREIDKNNNKKSVIEPVKPLVKKPFKGGGLGSFLKSKSKEEAPKSKEEDAPKEAPKSKEEDAPKDENPFQRHKRLKLAKSKNESFQDTINMYKKLFKEGKEPTKNKVQELREKLFLS